MEATNSGKKIDFWTGQGLHIALLLALLISTKAAWQSIGSPHPTLFWATIFIPVVHQVYVWFFWRLELSFKMVTKFKSMNLYYIVFFILLISRVLFATALGYTDASTLEISLPIRIGACILLAGPWIYLVYSVKKYFGFFRAAGADHFDEKYRKMALVREGIFRFTSNGMYLYGFFIFWLIAFGFASSAALVSAVFAHAYIWLHYFATEKPDMDHIYGS